MDFSKRKLPKEYIETLLRLKVETIQPFSLMLAPIYVYFPANEKLVSIKGPLDFFTPEELNRFKDHEFFYVSKFAGVATFYQAMGLQIREALRRKVTYQSDKAAQLGFGEISLPQIPYIVSDKILGLVGTLWSDRGAGEPGIEPFLATLAANEVCGHWPSDVLIHARERNVASLDWAILTSSWVVFLALHLGYCNLKFLKELRLKVFDEIMNRAQDAGHNEHPKNEIEELIVFAKGSLHYSKLRSIGLNNFKGRPEKVVQKLKFRLERIAREFLKKGEAPPSIFGEEGFIDA